MRLLVNVFANKLLKLWEDADSIQMAKFYNQDVQGYCGKLVYSYIDIANRLDYIKINHKCRKFFLLDLIVERNRFAMRFGYNAVSVLRDELIELTSLAVYHLQNNKISKVWLFNDININYLEK